MYISKELVDLAEKCGFPKSYRAAIVVTYDRMLHWLDSKEFFLQPILLAQFDLSKGWGFELTYRAATGWLANTDENEYHSNRWSALDEGIECALRYYARENKIEL